MRSVASGRLPSDQSLVPQPPERIVRRRASEQATERGSQSRSPLLLIRLAASGELLLRCREIVDKDGAVALRLRVDDGLLDDSDLHCSLLRRARDLMRQRDGCRFITA